MSEQLISINSSENLMISDNNYTNTIIQALVGPEGRVGPIGPAGPPGPRGPRGRAAPFYPRTVFASHSLTLNTTNNEIELLNATWIKLSAANIVNITGIYAGTDGELRILTNTSNFNIVIKHDSSEVASDKRILSFNNQDITITPNSSVSLIYDATVSKWRSVSLSAIGV